MTHSSVKFFVATTAALALSPSVASACGGCFAPSESQQVVTDHRMVMAIHQDESLLWDQIRYSGRPEEFAWILPVRGDVQIGLASGEFFDRLDALTAVQVTAPVVSCPRGSSSGGFGGANLSSARLAEDSGGVQVIQTSVVGPYVTVTLRATDTDALTGWLRSNNYAIPAAIEPTIRWYNDMHMDFVAMRLRPGQEVSAMQPVRIRFATPSPVLPLRMVSAGVADKVGITLFVFGQGRYEAQNFANASVNPDEVVWDFATNRSNYQQVFTSTLRRLNSGRAWITESSGVANQYAGNFTTQESQSDFAEALRGLSAPWVTRMRTDLSLANLGTDLTLASSAQNIEVPTRMSLSRALNRPPCVSDDGFYSGRDATRTSGLDCSISHSSEHQSAPRAVFFSLAAFGALIAGRRRTRIVSPKARAPR